MRKTQKTFQVWINRSRAKERTWIFSGVFTPAVQFLLVHWMNTCWHESTSEGRLSWLQSSAPLKHAMRHETLSLSKMTSGKVQLMGFLLHSFSLTESRLIVMPCRCHASCAKHAAWRERERERGAARRLWLNWLGIMSCHVEFRILSGWGVKHFQCFSS